MPTSLSEAWKAAYVVSILEAPSVAVVIQGRRCEIVYALVHLHTQKERVCRSGSGWIVATSSTTVFWLVNANTAGAQDEL